MSYFCHSWVGGFSSGEQWTNILFIIFILLQTSTQPFKMSDLLEFSKKNVTLRTKILHKWNSCFVIWNLFWAKLAPKFMKFRFHSKISAPHFGKLPSTLSNNDVSLFWITLDPSHIITVSVLSSQNHWPLSPVRVSLLYYWKGIKFLLVSLCTNVEKEMNVTVDNTLPFLPTLMAGGW